MLTKIALEKWVYKDPNSEERFYVYQPIVTILLGYNHKFTAPVKCLLDTGATINVFPEELALTFFGITKKTLQKGRVIEIQTVGNRKVFGYGLECTFQHPEFKIEKTLVYFVENQPYPLLGRVGFMDKFKKIVLDEEHKILELEKL